MVRASTPQAVPATNGTIDSSLAMNPDRFDRYEIREELGSGAMGVVYRAWDTRLQRPVALKFLSPHLATEEGARKRFIREARAASALDHTNIAVVYDAGEVEGGQVYIAMRYYEGETVEERLGEGPLSIEEAVEIARQVAEGLEVAHEAGIVHRDVKPGNVILTAEGVAKILDFGVAKMRAAVDVTASGEGSSPGTPSYMAPEQIRGGDVDGRADLWALGVLLYEMITGESCFPGRYQEAVFYAILHEDPTPIADLRGDVPGELEQLIRELLAKDPERRPQTAEVAADRLVEIGRSVRGDSQGTTAQIESEDRSAGAEESENGSEVEKEEKPAATSEESVRHPEVWNEVLAADERLIREFSVSNQWIRRWSLLLAIFAAFTFWGPEGSGSDTLGILALIWAIGYFYFYVPRSRIYGLTDRRIVLRRGWLSPETTSISYAQLADTQVKEPWLRGKMWGTGRLIVRPGGGKRTITIKHLDRPHELEHEIQKLVHLTQGTRS